MNNYYDAYEMNMPNNINSIYPGAFKNIDNKNYMNNSFNNKSNVDINLLEKLKKQAGDNMNFNMAGFNGEADPNQLYDVYNGFIRLSIS